MSDENNIVIEKEVAERLTEAVELLTARLTNLNQKTWMSIEEAAEYIGVTPSHIRTKISKGQLSLCGGPRAYRIYRPQLDEQVARCWPRLEVETNDDIAARILAARPPANSLPRVRQPALPRGSCKPLVFK